VTPEQAGALSAEAKAELWRRGDLEHKRFEHQHRATMRARQDREHFSLWTRRGGKSGDGVLECFEACAKPGGRALFLAPTAKSAAEIAGDLATKLLRDCPPDRRPHYDKQGKEFSWPAWDAVMRIKGVNGETYENLRGGEYDVVVPDEFAQYDEPEEILYGVVRPMLLTTKGRLRIQTTPPPSPSHYSVKLYREMFERGQTSLVTLRDVTHIEHAEKVRMLLTYGERPEEIEDILAGRREPRQNFVKREYFCQFVVDRDLAVVPDFAEHKAEIVVPEYQRPPHYDCYGSADMGMRDRTGILAAYLDYTNQRLIVEGERLLHKANTAKVAAEWSLMEAELGYNLRARVTRVVDDPSLRVSADLTTQHGLTAMPVDKKGREAAIARMNVAITAGQLRIVNCPLLVQQLETAIYKKSEKSLDFQRDTDGHFDLVDALIYLIRSVVWTKNPYPPGWQHSRLIHPMSTGAFRPPPQAVSRLNQTLYGGTPAGRRLLKGGKR